MNANNHLEDVVGKWEKRWHPLRMEWVVYAAHRNSRPWSFDTKKNKQKPLFYDAGCYLCPGNKRISGNVNPNYSDVYIFDNDHPVVGASAPEILNSSFYDGLYLKEKAEGIARVVCFHPRHDLTMSNIPVEYVSKVFASLRSQMIEFIDNSKIKFVLIFENKGELVGVSNPHPHCQIYATDFNFTLVERELKALSLYKKEKNANLFEAILHAEMKDGIRVIAENNDAIAFIPFFARYAYEVMIFPKKRHATLATMTDTELYGLADVFQKVSRLFDMNYQTHFPYVMSILQAPVDSGDYKDYHLHLLLQPPLRQPGLVKYLAGPEIGGGNFMADTMPEDKAKEFQKIDVTAFDSDKVYNH